MSLIFRLALPAILLSPPTAWAASIPSGCYRVFHPGLLGHFAESALLSIQATGQGSYLLRDDDGGLLKIGPKLERSLVAGPDTEFHDAGLGFPLIEMKAKDGRWLLMKNGQWSLGRKTLFPAALRLEKALGCPEAEVDIATRPASSFPAPLIVSPSSFSMRGIADLHAHPFANEAFGGKFFQGKAFDPYGASTALASCKEAHGPGGISDIAGNGLDGVASHDTSGFPSFKGWPAWNDSNHQQMYFRWMERAWHGGLRLLVAHAVNSEALCRLVDNRADYGCDDMLAVDRQLDAAYRMEAYVDAQFGGPGRGWLRIVTSPEEARRVIRSGKLAMVLGIEVDSLFGCRVGHCTEEDVIRELDRYWARGVRHLFPVHVTDNAFGGAALYTPMAFNVANRMQNGDFFLVEDCSAQGITYKEQSFGPAQYPDYEGQCNARGLSHLGVFAIRSMMNRGFLIDIDHMSLKMSDAVLSLAEEHAYPVIAGHTGFVVTSTPGQKRSEGQKTDDQLRRVIRLGGMVGAILQQGKAHKEVLNFGFVKNDCDNSSKAWAQAFTYALSAFREEGRAPGLSFGSDFNGLIALPAPRFGPDACAHNVDHAVEQQNPVAYPFASPWTRAEFGRMRSGTKIFDVNVDGFSNIGLLPDFIEELRMIGLPEEDLEALFHSAEAYVKLWERAEAARTSIAFP